MTDPRTPEQIALWEQEYATANNLLVREWGETSIVDVQLTEHIAAALLWARADQTLRCRAPRCSCRWERLDLLAAVPPHMKNWRP